MTLVPSLQAGSQFGKFSFSHDSKYIFSCCGMVIKVFNIANGECMHNLRGHVKPATGIVVNPSNNLQIVSCGQDGKLIYWDYLDGVQLKQFNLHVSLYGILSISAENKSIIALAQSTQHKSTFSLMLWKLKTLESSSSTPKMLVENCDGDQRLVSIGCQREFIASGFKHQMSIYSMKNGTTKVVSDNDKFNKLKSITCLACHPTDYCIATGLENGRIILWYSFFKVGHPQTTSFHWHALPVLCIGFSPNGSNFFSGGHECVLVRWQMENQNMRDFKPRMGAPITDVLCSPNGTLYATKHADNVIQLLDINLRVIQVYREMTQTSFGFGSHIGSIPVGLKFDPQSRTLVTNGLPGHLQFYSTNLCRQLFNLDIVGQNYISPETADKHTFVTEVTSIAISQDGIWLTTFEMWDDGVFSPEHRLKFWNCNCNTYSLNTTVEYPHDAKVTSLLFRPNTTAGTSPPTLVSIGADQCFKVWTLIDDSNIYRDNTRWGCDSVGHYRRLNASCADFSVDASTLAVAFEHLLTIWDPDNNVVRTTLSNSLENKENILHIKFGSDQCSNYVLVATTHTLLSWNLLTLTIQWTIKTTVITLVRDPSTDLIAIVSAKKVCMMKPNSPKMIYEQEIADIGDILDAVFVPDGRHEQIVGIGWPGRSQIYVYTTEQQLLTFDLSWDAETTSNKVKIAQSLPLGTLSTIMAEKSVKDQSTPELKTTVATANVAKELLLMDSNVPMSLLCEQYLNSLLVKKSGPVLTVPENVDPDKNCSESREIELEADKERKQHSTSIEKDLHHLLSKPVDWIDGCLPLFLK